MTVTRSYVIDTINPVEDATFARLQPVQDHLAKELLPARPGLDFTGPSEVLLTCAIPERYLLDPEPLDRLLRDLVRAVLGRVPVTYTDVEEMTPAQRLSRYQYRISLMSNSEVVTELAKMAVQAHSLRTSLSGAEQQAALLAISTHVVNRLDG